MLFSNALRSLETGFPREMKERFYAKNLASEVKEREEDKGEEQCENDH